MIVIYYTQYFQSLYNIGGWYLVLMPLCCMRGMWLVETPQPLPTEHGISLSKKNISLLNVSHHRFQRFRMRCSGVHILLAIWLMYICCAYRSSLFKYLFTNKPAWLSQTLRIPTSRVFFPSPSILCEVSLMKKENSKQSIYERSFKLNPNFKNGLACQSKSEQ